jgi:hypothetical protein
MFERYKPKHGNGDQETNGSVSKAVQEKFANYRPTPGNGTGHSTGRQTTPVDNGQKPREPIISCQAGDENSSTFWNLFASGDAERAVEKSTAIFVVKSIVSEILGTQRCGEVRFGSDPVTIGDVLATIDSRTVAYPIADFVQVEGDKIRSEHVYFDVQTVAEQLGLKPKKT